MNKHFLYFSNFSSKQRHDHVSKWTKNVDIFEKDFLIFPINKHGHWFLAIVCFPSLDFRKSDAEQNETYSLDGNDKENINNQITIDRDCIRRLAKFLFNLYIK
jgi:sentrin-specific protease 7